jgi:hypothetical protein
MGRNISQARAAAGEFRFPTIVKSANIPMLNGTHDKITVFCHSRTPCGNAIDPTKLFLTALFQEFKHVITDPDFR